jgi:tripartite-type tricarboxylate transporter receptor subunit TctC
MEKLMDKIRLSLVFGLMLACAVGAQAQGGYPSKPVTLVVPYPAGGPMDKLARELVQPMQRQLGQPVVIQNLSGSGGNLGSAIAMRAAADGHTLLFNHIGMATAPALYRHLGFNPESDFEPLGIVAESPLMLVSRPQVPSGSVVELVRWMASQPQVRLANGGIGSASHLCGLMLQSSLGIRMTTVPYRGTAPALADLLGGHVDLMCDLTANVLPHVSGKKIKPVGVTSGKPLVAPGASAIPTLEKFGIPSVRLGIWYGLYAPKNTPQAVQARINSALLAAIQTDTFKQAQLASGIDVVRDTRNTPAGHREYLRSEIARWTPVIKAAGAYAD